MFILLSVSCGNNHFIKDPEYRIKVEEQFQKQIEIAKNRDAKLFKNFSKGLSNIEIEALQFLYAYMPLSDLADYDSKFFIKMVEYSLKARQELPWGMDIPDDIFRHYVLAYRVNNENLDEFRAVYYEELKDRVKDLDLEKAALEINHWCHEKVTYKASDIRTSGPLATINTGFGRCGEESTLTVSAMRAVGIPARQVYTPRWAHVDDNHAWVEVWINGEWRILGACEPDPYLDMGWFIEPATRAMFIHTKAFGRYEGDEDINALHDRFAELNILNRYTDTRRISVIVVDNYGQPVKDAFVEFQLFNYSEFYPLTRKITNVDGIVDFKTGLGDLMIWAGKGQKFSYKKIRVNNKDTIKLALLNSPGKEYNFDLNILPPNKIDRKNGDMGDRDISERLKNEDKIRAAYENTFMKQEEAYKIASRQHFDRDEVWKYIKLSGGNWKEVASFCDSLTDMSRHWALDFLSTLSDKDLRDVVYNDIYWDHLNNNTLFTDSINKKYDKDIFLNYVLGPRISNEALKPYKSLFQIKFGKEFIKQCRKDINVLCHWIDSNIEILEDANYYNVPISPAGVYELRVSDIFSLKIFFIAVCRSFGIPARFDKSKNIPQYYFDGEWADMYLIEKQLHKDKAFVKFNNSDNSIDPEYYLHFTIARFSNAKYHTIDFDYNKKLSKFTEPLELEAGHYMLVTGNRMDDGSVLSRISFFSLPANQTKEIEIVVRKE